MKREEIINFFAMIYGKEKLENDEEVYSENIDPDEFPDVFDYDPFYMMQARRDYLGLDYSDDEHDNEVRQEKQLVEIIILWLADYLRNNGKYIYGSNIWVWIDTICRYFIYGRCYGETTDDVICSLKKNE